MLLWTLRFGFGPDPSRRSAVAHPLRSIPQRSATCQLPQYSLTSQPTLRIVRRHLRNRRSKLTSTFSMVEKLHVFNGLYRQASNYFYSDRLRRAFTFSSMYRESHFSAFRSRITDSLPSPVGMSPYNAPATYNLLQYTELAQGIWYPIGGFNKVVDSYEKIARKKFGAEFRYNSPVTSISQSADGKHATGVTLATGEHIEADVVISNADLLWTYENLLPSTKYQKAICKNSKLTCSSISFYWGMKRKVDALTTHNIFLGEEYAGSFDKIFDEHSLPDEASFCKSENYIFIRGQV